MVKAGLMRDRVAFQRLDEEAVDNFGNVYRGWVDLANRSADLRERRGRDRITGGVLSDVGTATMRVRYDSTTKTITTADRVFARGITWAIKDVLQLDSRATVIEFVIEKGVAQ